MSKQPDNNSSTKNPVGRFMVATGAVIELKDSGKILIVQRAKDLDWQPNEWEITYGRIDQFENPEDGLKREISEEIGIQDIKVDDILTVWHIFRGGKKIVENDLIGITYWCKTDTEEVKLSSEHQDYKWVTPNEALEIISVEGIKRDVLKFIEKRDK